MPGTGSLIVNVYDGTRQPIGAGRSLQVTVIDGNQKTLIDKQNYALPSLLFKDLPFYNNYGDNYTVVVWANGCLQAGYTPVKIYPNTVQHLDLMLLPANGHFNFAQALWPQLQQSYPEFAALLASGLTPADAQARYDRLREDETTELSLASFFNLATAMSAINLPSLETLRTPLDYIKQIIWDDPQHAFAQDRFFGWADKRLIDQVKLATLQHEFQPEIDPWIFHPTATSSWKQITFGEANVQLTFHEGETRQIDCVDCVMIEPDIDYYKDLAAHFLQEVVVNAVSHTLTDPKQVYQLRWIAGRRAGMPDFNPPYTIVA